MADVDNKNTPDQNKPGEAIAEFRSELKNSLLEVQETLKAMNQSYSQGFTELSQRVSPTKPQPTITDADVFDPAGLRDKVLAQAGQLTSEILAEERRKNATIYNLSQEYPEIQTDSTLQKSILDMQRTLPKGLQDKADGYEMAVLKAIAKQGILPKSKRPAPTTNDDFSVSSRGTSERPRSRAKVAENTLIISQLLGRDIEDPKVLAGLEEAANRDTWTRYR